MKLFGRNIAPGKVPARLIEALSMLAPSLAFKHPFSVWQAYLREQSPEQGSVPFKDGMRAWLSDNPHDIVTLMVNFCKRDYGTIEPNSLVIDIGANIGMFSLYACRSGAETLLAFEPNLIAYQTLARNVTQPNIKTNVQLFNKAVSGTEGETVYISSTSSPYNQTSSQFDSKIATPVITTDLDKIISLCNGRQVDYLKVDCEGAEWDIFSKCSEESLFRIKRIRMEFHPIRGRSRNEIFDRLTNAGFKLVHEKHLITWFER